MASGSTSASRNSQGSIPSRRLSYASVASGAARQHPTSSPRLDTQENTTTRTNPNQSSSPSTLGFSLISEASPASERSRNSSTREYDMASGDTTKSPSFIEQSRRYTSTTRDGSSTFFIPSYLRASRYATKLEALHETKSRNESGRSVSTPSLTTSTGNPNIQRMAPSHRGMTYDIIESNPPKEEEELMPLPSKWNNQDKYPGMDVTNDGLDVKYNGAAGKAEQEAASVRANYPISPACGIYYYEVEIKQKSKDCAVAIGFATLKASLERLPGWESDSWGYHGDDGRLFWGEHQGRNYGPSFTAGDVVGCGLIFSTGQAFFTRNGLDLGIAFRDLKNLRPFPAVGIKKYSGAGVSVNFGQRPFVYDIDARVEREKIQVREKVRSTKTAYLHPGLDEHSLAQELVAQFLSHGGYVETTEAFARERQTEQTALNENQDKTIRNRSDYDDTGAVYRQEIRRAVLDGNIERALSLANDHFPEVLVQSPETAFRLKCRKWIELIGAASDLSAKQAASSQLSSKSDRDWTTIAHGEFDQHMELDEEQQVSLGGDHDGEVGEQSSAAEAENDVTYDSLLAEAMEYGQLLNREYRDETDNDYKKTLADIFSLVAYNDPRKSIHGYLLNKDGRVKVAEELNSAILVSIGRSPSAALEKTYRQTEGLLDILSQEGGPAAFVNLRTDFDPAG